MKLWILHCTFHAKITSECVNYIIDFNIRLLNAVCVYKVIIVLSTWMVYLQTPRVFHSLIDLSLDPETICLLSAEKATLRTSLSWLSNKRVVVPLKSTIVKINATSFLPVCSMGMISNSININNVFTLHTQKKFPIQKLMQGF